MARRKATPKDSAESKASREKPLTPKERLFVHYFLGEANHNASEAARLAGYLRPGQYGHELLKKPEIRAAVDAKIETVGMTAKEVLTRLAAMATADPMEFFVVNGFGVPRIDLRKAQRTGRTFLIRSLECRADGSVKLTLHNSQDALDKLAKILGMYQAETAVKAAEPVNPLVAAVLLEAAERLGQGEAREVKEKG